MSRLITPSYYQGFARYAGESEAPGLWHGLVAAWLAFPGPTGWTLHDVLKRYPGTLTNMAPATDWIPTVDRWGNPIYALEFDGSDDYVDLGNFELINSTAPFSVSFWMYLHDYTDTAYPTAVVFDTNLATGFKVFFSASSGYEGIDFGSDTNWVERRSAGDISANLLNVWRLITLTYNGNDPTESGNYTLYLDSDALGAVNSSGFAATPNANYLGQASGGSGHNFDGLISSLLFYNVELAADAVKQLYSDSYTMWRLRYPPLGKAAAAAGVAPTSVFYGPLFGPLRGPV